MRFPSVLALLALLAVLGNGRAGDAPVTPATLAGNGPEARAAAIAAPRADDAWALLDDLARAADSRDRALAAPAARSAAAIASELDRVALHDADAPHDLVDAAARVWAAIAAADDRWTDVRVHALVAAAHLAEVVADGDPAAARSTVLAPLADDDDPELRRAAVELFPLPLSDGDAATAARLLTGDADDTVALAAAQALCAGLAVGDDPAPVLARLGDAGVARIRALLAPEASPTAPPAVPLSPPALLDAARCLAADGSKESRAALRALSARGPPSIRRAVARLPRSRRR